jgi:hypothetical protein
MSKVKAVKKAVRKKANPLASIERMEKQMVKDWKFVTDRSDIFPRFAKRSGDPVKDLKKAILETKASAAKKAAKSSRVNLGAAAPKKKGK